MDWEYQLISVYLFVCTHHQTILKNFVQRMSNNVNLGFTDEEVITIYLCGLMEKRHTLKEIYVYADRRLRGHFPLLPSYIAFVQRINIISGVFIPLLEILTDECSLLSSSSALLVDAMPIGIPPHQLALTNSASLQSDLAPSFRFNSTPWGKAVKQIHFSALGTSFTVLAANRISF